MKKEKKMWNVKNNSLRKKEKRTNIKTKWKRKKEKHKKKKERKINERKKIKYDSMQNDSGKWKAANNINKEIRIKERKTFDIKGRKNGIKWVEVRNYKQSIDSK